MDSSITKLQLHKLSKARHSAPSRQLSPTGWCCHSVRLQPPAGCKGTCPSSLEVHQTGSGQPEHSACETTWNSGTNMNGAKQTGPIDSNTMRLRAITNISCHIISYHIKSHTHMYTYIYISTGICICT